MTELVDCTDEMEKIAEKKVTERMIANFHKHLQDEERSAATIQKYE